jgi:hypothetical protein
LNIVNITAQPLSTKLIPLGDFSIIGPGKTIDYKEDLKVERSYLSERISLISGSLTTDELEAITGATLQLEIENTNGLGNLIVEINGVEVFNKKVDVGFVNIPIDPSLLMEKNTIKIKAGLPGWILWATTVYEIKSAKFFVTFQGIYGKEFTFSLNANEATNFAELQLQFLVSRYSTPLQELFIEVNDQLIYASEPPLAMFNKTFSKDIYGNNIIMLPGNNKIRFSFKKSGLYEISNALLKILYFGA